MHGCRRDQKGGAAASVHHDGRVHSVQHIRCPVQSEFHVVLAVASGVFAHGADLGHVRGEAPIRQRVHGHIRAHPEFILKDIQFVHSDADCHAVVRYDGENGLLLQVVEAVVLFLRLGSAHH